MPTAEDTSLVIERKEQRSAAAASSLGAEDRDQRAQANRPQFHRLWRKWRIYAWFGTAVLMLGATGVAALRFAHSFPSNDGRAEPPHVPVVEGDTVVLPDGFAKRIKLQLANVEQRELTPLVRAVGTASFDPQYEQVVGTPVAGLVTQIHCFEGDLVRKGTVLAEVTSAELAEAQADVLVAKASREAAQRNAKRETELSSRGLSTAREAEEAARLLREQQARLTAALHRVRTLGGDPSATTGSYALTAELEGTVVERHVSRGQAVDANVEAFRLANLDHLWVEMKVPETRVAQVRLGDSVRIHPIATQSAEAIEGRVAHVGQIIDAATRTADIRIEVDNRARALRVGQSVSAEIQATGPRREVMVVPEAAVVDIDGDKCVFVAESKTRMRRQSVDIGATDGRYREVRIGLDEGERVVTQGVFALKSELYR